MGVSTDINTDSFITKAYSVVILVTIIILASIYLSTDVSQALELPYGIYYYEAPKNVLIPTFINFELFLVVVLMSLRLVTARNRVLIDSVFSIATLVAIVLTIILMGYGSVRAFSIMLFITGIIIALTLLASLLQRSWTKFDLALIPLPFLLWYQATVYGKIN